jgi:hypothetical protein
MQGTPNAALQAQLQAQADKTIATGLSKATKKTATKKKAPVKKAAPTKKSVKLTPEEQPWTDKTPAPAGKEFKYHHLRGK